MSAFCLHIRRLVGRWQEPAVATVVGAIALVVATPMVMSAQQTGNTTSATVGQDPAANGPGSGFTMAQTVSDEAQRTTLAFSALAMMTGNLDAQSFFPPGKVADYTGFQYLRDNDPDGMGHNTSFLTRVANNVIYVLNDTQFAQLKTLAVAQTDHINLYGYKRFPLMKAFRRLLEGDVPTGSTGLNLDAVKKASRELYLIDGQISFDRALLYATILNSMDATQKAYLAAMKGKGWGSWPDITDDQIRAKMQGLPQGTSVAVMTYASDLFSWYAGSVEADVYFCPERHGTYFGSFYIKDAPAIGHEGYSINEQLTATAGAALSESAKGYVTAAQAAVMSSLVETQRNNLYASSTTNIVTVRTEIATLLRGLLVSTASSAAVKARVLELSGIYGDLDGENNHAYATVTAQVYKTLTTAQKTALANLRQSIMSGTYADGTRFDYSLCTTPFLYSSVIADQALLAPYISNTDYLFFAGATPTAAFLVSPNAPVAGETITFIDASAGGPTSWLWIFGDGGTSVLQNPTHAYRTVGTYTITLAASNDGGSNTTVKTVAVTAAGSALLTPSIVWANPSSVAAGSALSATQLNASANVAGSFAYTPAAGTVVAAGTLTLSTTFTPTDTAHYARATATTTLVVTAGTAAFVGPSAGGPATGRVNSSQTQLTYNGTVYPIVNGKVTFPDCTVYIALNNGILIPAGTAAGCTPTGSSATSGSSRASSSNSSGGTSSTFVGPSSGGPATGSVSGTTLTYNGSTHLIVNGKVTFPDCTVYIALDSGILIPAGTASGCTPTGSRATSSGSSSSTGASTGSAGSGSSNGGSSGGSSSTFAGPRSGGPATGSVSGRTLTYNGASFTIVNGKVTFPDCTVYIALDSGILIPAGTASGCTASDATVGNSVRWTDVCPVERSDPRAMPARGSISSAAVDLGVG
ncbi:MAG: PKD domain-containing protein [Acidobacteriota bacterium]